MGLKPQQGGPPPHRQSSLPEEWMSQDTDIGFTRQGMNLRTWHQAANFIYYVKGISAIDPCVYALLVRFCRTVIIKLRRRVIKLTALKWKCTLDSDMTYPGLHTCNPVESNQDDGHWRAQPPRVG